MVALAVLLRRRGYLEEVELTGSDISADALAVAVENVVAHAVADRVTLARGDLLDIPDRAPVDVLLANLPYIPSGLVAGLSAEVRAEPVLALDGGADGMDLMRRLLAGLPEVLLPGGVALLEMGADQADLMTAAVGAMPGSWALELHRDLAGLPRIAEVRRSRRDMTPRVLAADDPEALDAAVAAIERRSHRGPADGDRLRPRRAAPGRTARGARVRQGTAPRQGHRAAHRWPRPGRPPGAHPRRRPTPGGDVLAGRTDARAATATGRAAAGGRDRVVGDTLGVRLPDHPVPRTLARRLGPLAVSSANRSGEPDARTAAELVASVGAALAVVLDDGPVRGGVPSTVVAVSADGRLTILRAGALDAASPRGGGRLMSSHPVPAARAKWWSRVH